MKYIQQNHVNEPYTTPFQHGHQYKKASLNFSELTLKFDEMVSSEANAEKLEAAHH